MAIEIPFEASVDTGEGAKSLRSLKQEFKETQKELDGLNVGSEKYVATLKKLGAVRDEIGDLNAEINAFNPEGKVQAFGNVIGGLASGFQAATGAAALFGAESEDVQKALLKVQAVMAFTEGIKGITSLGDSFTVFTSILKSTAVGQKLVTAAQWLWNAAVSANPITLLITALVALVGVMKLWASSSEDAAAKQERMNELQREHTKLVEADVDAIKRRFDILNKSYKSEIDLLKAKGATIEEINKKEDEIYEKRRAQLLYIQGFRGKLTAEESAELLALTKEKILRDTAYIKTVNDNLEKATQKNKDELAKQSLDKKKQADEDWKAAEAEADRLMAIEVKSAADLLALKKAQKKSVRAAEIQDDIEARAEAERLQKEEDDKAIKAKADELNSKLALEQAAFEGSQALFDTFFNIRLATVKKGSKEEEKAARAQFNINKALSASSTTIATIQGVQNALTPKLNDLTPEPLATGLRIAQAVSIGLKGAAAVSKILSAQFGSTGGLSVSAIQPPSLGGAPNLNAPRNSTTTLDPDGTVRNPSTQKPQVVKAYVVETEMTNSQKRIISLEAAAKIG